jgi:gluconolactonase
VCQGDWRRRETYIRGCHGDHNSKFAPGWFDGIRLDTNGRVWAASIDGLHCYDPDGSLLGRLRTPEGVSNLTFGGPGRNHLFITTNCGDVYSIRVTFTGVKTV